MATIQNPTPYLPLSGGTVTGNVSVAGHIQAVPGTAPTAVAGGNNGTGPPAPVVVTGSLDNGGKITFGSGTGPSAGTQVAVTFGTAWVIPGGGTPHVVATPANTATQALGIIISGESPVGFNIVTTNAPAAGQANTVYAIHYDSVG